MKYSYPIKLKANISINLETDKDEIASIEDEVIRLLKLEADTVVDVVSDGSKLVFVDASLDFDSIQVVTDYEEK